MIGVLELVDQHVGEAPHHRVAKGIVGFERTHGAVDQVTKVEGIGLLQPLFVRRIHAAHDLGPGVGRLDVVGPLNFAYARKRGRPVLLLATIPLLSVGVASLLLMYGVVRDGVGLRTAVQSIVVLDQRTHEVAAASAREVFAGLMSERTVRPDAGTVVVPEVRRDDSERSARFRVALGSETELSGDFIGTRSVRRLRTIEQRSSRLRLDLRPEGGGWRATNGLEAGLSDLVFRDAAGELFAVDQLDSGGEAVLTPASEDRAEAVLTRLGIGDGVALTERLLPGSYAAMVDGPQLIDDLGIGGRAIEQRHGLIGIVDWAAAGGGTR